MKRKIYQDLLDWKNSEDRKPLLIQGARQVGKTYIINMFGTENYNNVVYCNFEKDIQLHSIFSDLDPIRIIKELSNYKRKEIIPGHTLILFDEIQACPKALTSLKYFCEDANEYHVIASGSLLGVAVNRVEFSFPVGKINQLTMYPMDFEEFLMAFNEDQLIDSIKDSYINNKALSWVLHNSAIEYYKQYLYIGGMPEVIEEYVKTKNYDLVRNKQQVIYDTYFNDMAKYNKNTEIPKVRMVYKNISVQLAKENKKYKYSLIKTGGRSSEFATAIEWLCVSGIAHQLYRIEQIKLPLNAYRSLDDFKFYMNDVGLCACSQNILVNDIIFDNVDFNDFKGGLTENYVNNQLILNKLDLSYWTSGNQAEIDFITRLGSDIIPIEVKSNANVKSRSLNEYTNKYSPSYSIRVSTRNFGFENGIKSVPLYAVFCMK